MIGGLLAIAILSARSGITGDTPRISALSARSEARS
jgi:hypothetical protein